jgi:hypothetical protein
MVKSEVVPVTGTSEEGSLVGLPKPVFVGMDVCVAVVQPVSMPITITVKVARNMFTPIGSIH